MIRASSLACLVLFALCAEAAARCSVRPVAEYPGQTVDTQMTVSSGAPCGWGLGNSLGPTFTTHTVRQPSHGTVYFIKTHDVIYRSRPGFVGSDSFTFARRGASMGGSSHVRTVRVSVTVTPP
jgi:hypothetical protein